MAYGLRHRRTTYCRVDLKTGRRAMTRAKQVGETWRINEADVRSADVLSRLYSRFSVSYRRRSRRETCTGLRGN